MDRKKYPGNLTFLRLHNNILLLLDKGIFVKILKDDDFETVVDDDILVVDERLNQQLFEEDTDDKHHDKQNFALLLC